MGVMSDKIASPWASHGYTTWQRIENLTAENKLLRDLLADVIGYGTILPDELYSRIRWVLDSHD